MGLGEGGDGRSRSSAPPGRAHWLSRLPKQTPKSGLEPDLLRLPAVMESLASAASSWKEIIQETASCWVRIAKIHSLESWRLKILFKFEQFLQPTCWVSISLWFILVQRKVRGGKGLTVGILADTSQRWYWQKGLLDVPHRTHPWPRTLCSKVHFFWTPWSKYQCLEVSC